MYRGYKIVLNTAAGRRRYMQYLIPYIVSCEIVDRYDIWINTHNGADIEFFKIMAHKYSIIKLVWQPDGVVNGISSINAFYRQCVENETIYFKLDDDIVWMEPGLIEKMVKFRVDNPDYFLVSPLVINNSLSTYLLQLEGKIKLDSYYASFASHPILWKSGTFATELHSWFINQYLRTRKWTDLHLGKKEMGMTRFSINSVLWFGEMMQNIEGIVPGDDEEYMSCIYPTLLGKSNAWNGDAIVAHFAFFTQREQLDKQNILEQYGEILETEWTSNEEMREIHEYVQNVMNHIGSCEEELMKRKSPYKRIEKPCTWRTKIKKYLPQNIIELWKIYRNTYKKSNFIIK
mgnify:CR=1 FL=1